MGYTSIPSGPRLFQVKTAMSLILPALEWTVAATFYQTTHDLPGGKTSLFLTDYPACPVTESAGSETGTPASPWSALALQAKTVDDHAETVAALASGVFTGVTSGTVLDMSTGETWCEGYTRTISGYDSVSWYTSTPGYATYNKSLLNLYEHGRASNWGWIWGEDVTLQL